MFAAGWLLLVMHFAWQRLKNTSHTWPHVFEMIITSAGIPFLSVYWNWYGAWKYRVLLW
jgi:hypothetical protein